MALQRRHLEVLVTIADVGSIHRAAQRMGVAQPAVSRMLGEVERVVGARLFERSAAGSATTQRGEALLSQARSVLRGLERIDAIAAARVGPIRFGCIPRAMHTLMPRVLGLRGGDDNSSMKLQVIEGDSTRLFSALQRGEIDFAVMRHASGPGDIQLPLVAEPLYEERPLVVAEPGHALTRIRRLDLATVHSRGWVLPASGTTSRGIFDDHCRQLRLPPIEPMIETRSFESSAALVNGTGLLSLIPESIARQYQRDGRVAVLPVGPPLPVLPILLVSHHAAGEDVLLAALRRRLLEAAQEIQAALAIRVRPAGG